MSDREAIEERTGRIPIAWLLAPFGVVAATSIVADWIWPSLINDHPLLLLAMSAKNRFLLLTAPQLGALAFFVVGFARLLLTDPITYVLGRQYGEQALTWIEDKTSTAKPGRSFIRGAERLFERSAPLVILIAPSALWCMLAGAARMRVVTFITCNVVGTVARLTLFWFAADALRAPLESMLETIEEFQTPLIGVTVGLGVLQAVRTRRRRGVARRDGVEIEVDVATAR
jgi:membrane protein DedA with SNARE-associated domain